MARVDELLTLPNSSDNNKLPSSFQNNKERSCKKKKKNIGHAFLIPTSFGASPSWRQREEEKRNDDYATRFETLLCDQSH